MNAMFDLPVPPVSQIMSSTIHSELTEHIENKTEIQKVRADHEAVTTEYENNILQ